MPQNLERDFQKAALKLRQKNRNILRRRISLYIFALIITTGLFYFIFQCSFLSIANMNIVTVLGVILLIIIIYFLKDNLTFNLKTSVFKLNSVRNNRFVFFRYFRIQHWLLISVLLVSGINPHLSKDFSVRFLYNPTPPGIASSWPWKNNETIHPIIASITPDIESSIKSVAEYIARQESDPSLQIKALHDYVINRVSYDFDSLEIGRRQHQDAQSVFSTRKAVCEGYTNLFMALGKSIGIDVAVIQGNIRRDLSARNLASLNIRQIDPRNDLTLHAWNAVKIVGNWQLVDTTWDDSDIRSPYNPHYLMPPPEVMIVSHFPEQSAWQLLRRPMNRDDFEKQSNPA